MMDNVDWQHSPQPKPERKPFREIAPIRPSNSRFRTVIQGGNTECRVDPSSQFA